jgi:Ni2+-binding GTPase involved in maturation of urease and hydrogenase
MWLGFEFCTLNLRETADTLRISFMTSPARYIMIGGFLGAGKTTAVAALAKHFTEQGQRVGLITNDQGRELVDTRMLQSRGFATEEIPGGCFCCKFNSLVDAAQRLTQAAAPEVFIAEPVGSCTDLVATVTYPLRRIYGENFTIAPLSVLVDPHRARRILGLDTGSGFSEKVLYIYRKQLEEADLICVSKRDLMDAAGLDTLIDALTREFPGKRVLAISAREGTGLGEWFDILKREDQVPRPALEIDYDVYADGEALLGWLNATLILEADDEVESGPILEALATHIQRSLLADGSEVAHLKMTLTPDHGLHGEVAVINLVRNDFRPEFGQELEEPVTGAQIILNLRAEADPERLAVIVTDAVARSALALPGCRLTLDHLERFRPGRPVPTHRDAVESQA